MTVATNDLRLGLEERREQLRGEVGADRAGFARDYAVESLLELWDAEAYGGNGTQQAKSLNSAAVHALVSIALSLSDERA